MSNPRPLYFHPPSTQLIMWGKADEFKADAAATKAFRAAAKSLKGKLMFVTSNADTEAAAPIAKFFGLEGETGPAVGF